MHIIIIIIIIILLQLGVHPVYTGTDKESVYIKGTIQNKVHTINKVHTVQVQTYKVTQGHRQNFSNMIMNQWKNEWMCKDGP
jgi:hypothetical protein